MPGTKKDKAVVLATLNATDTLVARTRGAKIEVGVVSTVDVGQGEPISVTADDRGMLDISPRTRDASVTRAPYSKQYTKNWDGIFGQKQKSASVSVN
jgi:citrate lyase gamma subunit